MSGLTNHHCSCFVKGESFSKQKFKAMQKQVCLKSFNQCMHYSGLMSCDNAVVEMLM